MERSGKKKKREKSSAFSISDGVADQLTHKHTHTRAHTQMYTLQMYSPRIKREVVFFFFLSFPFADKERRGSNLSAKLLHRWSENVKVSTCAFLPSVSLYLFNPPIIDSHCDKAQLTRRWRKNIYISLFFIFFYEAGIIRKPIYRDKRYFLLDGSYRELL